jgi:hypothetical protein
MRTRVILIILPILLALPTIVRAQYLWNTANLGQVRNDPERIEYQGAVQALVEKADAALAREPYSVMQKASTAASGDKHDYVSLARYFWPDPSKPDGLPYVNRDGQVNPEIDLYDRQPLGQMAADVTTLSLAWYITRNEAYARKAVELLRVWFLDPATRMNPNLEYSQMVPGVNNGKGRCYGLIDSYSFVEMLDGVTLLESSKAFTKRDSRQLKAWFADFLEWFLTSDQGKEESRQKNNHAMAYDVQVVAFACYTGNREAAMAVIDAFSDKRLFTHIEPDGSQPNELWRTLAFHYSIFNVKHMVDMFAFSSKLGSRLHTAVSPDGRTFYKAVDFLTPYLGKSVTDWPWKQISDWEAEQQELCDELFRIYSMDPSKKDYLALARRYSRTGRRSRSVLTRGNMSLTVAAFDCAAEQVDLALKSIGEPLPNAEPASPRSIEPDGTLRTVGPRDWTSGFFPGSLWYLYEFTGHERFRAGADRFTRSIEGEKEDRSSHDVGFKINCSFGNAYRLTGDEYYRDVLVAAANTLIERFDERVGAIRSWDFNRERWSYPVIIDNMMNLELLFAASELTGDSTYFRVADRHAATTLKNHFRDDASSFHVVDYDPATGEVRGRMTFQGYSDASAWARGQAWGLYGYTMCYRYTRNPAYLAQAERIAEFMFGHPNLPEDKVPYWDFNAPDIPSAPRDASAAAIAASALYELAEYAATDYAALADRILESLARNYRAEEGTLHGFLLRHSVGFKPGGDEIDTPLVYADYYYLEALLRKFKSEN